MAIKQDSLIKALVKFKIVKDEADAKILIEDKEEKELVIDAETVLFSPADLKIRDNQKYKEGKEAGEEMLIKNLFEEQGISITGKKDTKTFLSEHEKKVLENAKLSVDEKVKEKEKVIDGLRNCVKSFEDQIKALEIRSKQAETDSKLLGLLHPKRDDRFNDQQYLTLLKSQYELIEYEGKPAVKNLTTGEIEKDSKTFTPIAPADVFKSHFESSKWIKDDSILTTVAGRGGSDSKFKPSSSIQNMTQFREYLKEKGIESPTGEKAMAEYREVTKNNPNFDPRA